VSPPGLTFPHSACARSPVKAPVSASWFGKPTIDSTVFQPDPRFGFLFPALGLGVETPG